ncbi:hypothetical protein [Xylanimonas cellulosilytica]|uniref:hypothetical protein n=1 Tax=Xylanimonas cellulosilytica TaxID=186189 RepID=UPI00066074F6|nr:hypothetical protein [Xylanimonas cellulosilytica]
MSSNYPMGASPDASRAPRKRKGLLWLRIFLLTWVAFILAFILNMCDRDDSHPTPQPSVAWGNASPTGYRGSAQNTRALSPEWASGIAVAWTQPFDAAAAAVPPRLFAEGSTLYVVSYGPNSNAVTTISAYDVSGSEPSALWTTTGPRPSHLRTYAYPEFLSTGTHLVIGPLLVDKATGEQALAPWGNELPMGVAQGVLVTCDTVETCSGWTDEEGTWTQQWSATTSPQSHNGLTSLSPTTAPSDAVVGSGESASVLVPVDDAHYAPQLVDPSSGQVHTLGTQTTRDEDGTPRVTVARDGVAIGGSDNTINAYDSSGTVVDTYKITIQWVRPTSDSSLPTLEQLRSFYTKETTPWTTSFVSAEGSTDHSPPLLEISTSTGESLSMQPDGAFLKESSQPNFFSSVAMRSSADGSVLYLRGAGPAGTPAFVFAMADNVTNRSEQLDQTINQTWVFDDLLVGVTKDGLVAFTPDRD